MTKEPSNVPEENEKKEAGPTKPVLSPLQRRPMGGMPIVNVDVTHVGIERLPTVFEMMVQIGLYIMIPVSWGLVEHTEGLANFAATVAAIAITTASVNAIYHAILRNHNERMQQSHKLPPEVENIIKNLGKQ